MLSAPKQRKISKSKSKKTSEWIIPEEKILAILYAAEEAMGQVNIEQTGAVLTLSDETDENQLWKLIIAKNDVTDQIQTFILDPKHTLGKGGQGEVVLAQNIETAELVAIKVQNALLNMNFEEDLTRERRNLRQYKNRLVSAREGELDSRTEYTLMNYCPGNNLLQFLYETNEKSKDTPDYFMSKRELTNDQMTRLTILILQQYIDLHEAGLVHRDIKLENLVLNTNGFNSHWRQIALVDLGSAIIAEKEKVRDFMGTFAYVAPEMYQIPILNRSYWDYACDAFSLGVVLAEVVTKENFQRGAQAIQQEFKKLDEQKPLPLEAMHRLMPDIFGKQATIEHKVDTLSAIIALINKLTDSDRSKRPDLKELKAVLATLTKMECMDRIYKTYSRPSDSLDQYKKMRRDSVLLEKPGSISSTTKITDAELISPRKSTSNLQGNQNKHFEKTLRHSSKPVKVQKTPSETVANKTLEKSSEKKMKTRPSLASFRSISVAVIDVTKIKEKDKKMRATSARGEKSDGAQDDFTTDFSLNGEKIKKDCSIVSSKNSKIKTNVLIQVTTTSSIEELTASFKSLTLEVEPTSSSYTNRPGSLQTDKTILSLFNLQVSRIAQAENPNEIEPALLSLQKLAKSYRPAGRKEMDETVASIKETTENCLLKRYGMTIS